MVWRIEVVLVFANYIRGLVFKRPDAARMGRVGNLSAHALGGDYSIVGGWPSDSVGA